MIRNYTTFIKSGCYELLVYMIPNLVKGLLPKVSVVCNKRTFIGSGSIRSHRNEILCIQKDAGLAGDKILNVYSYIFPIVWHPLIITSTLKWWS